MLVMKRRVNEEIHIKTRDGIVVVTLAQVCSARDSKIGVIAAPHVEIWREEISPQDVVDEVRKLKKSLE